MLDRGVLGAASQPVRIRGHTHTEIHIRVDRGKLAAPTNESGQRISSVIVGTESIGKYESKIAARLIAIDNDKCFAADARHHFDIDYH